MACKRKRSSSTISPFSDSSYASPSERDSSHSPTPLARALYPSSAPHIDMADNMADTTHQSRNWSMPAAVMAESTSRHLDSRTRKRFRNGRPDERIVHKNTFQKLFSAQRSAGVTPIPSLPQAPPLSSLPPSSTEAQRAVPQTSLDAFWTLPACPSICRTFDAATPSPSVGEVLRCEDCDAPLAPADALDVEMGGVDVESGYACRKCGRDVCGMCAVVGDGRTCLECATSTRR